MRQDVEKHIRIAEEMLREMEQLMAEGLYKGVIKRVYPALLNAATAALLARDAGEGARREMLSDFNEAFVKTGLLDEKFYNYLSHVSNARRGADSSSDSADNRQAQTELVRAKEFVAACRTLCD